jgi:acetylornithine/succinyldiaminopimelate/putrescine aminotransferase
MALDRLTTTEARVAGLFASGYAHGEITAELEISPQEPESHVAGVFRKFGIHAGLFVTAAGESVLRPTPPLIVGDEEIDQALAILAEVLACRARPVSCNSWGSSPPTARRCPSRPC